MKISILLPYKENFSPQYPGAVSLFINSMNKLSIYKKEITVYGSTDLNDKFSDNYVNIELKKSFLKSQTRDYVNKFVELHKNQNIDEIDSAIESLNKSWEGASQEIYKASQEQQQAGQATQSQSSTENNKAEDKKGDDISDVDFEEVKDDDKK